MRPVLSRDRFIAVSFILGLILAVVAGYLVWHFTRANQARLAIRSRRTQIRTLWGEVRSFAFRGFVVLVVFILLMFVALKF